MHLPPVLVLPHWRSVLRHALPNVIEGKVVPVIVFVGLLQLVGTVAALLGALTWSLGAIAVRVLRKRAASGLLILTSMGLITRTIAALATGSLFVYFLQPTLTTIAVAMAFLVSVPLGKPLAERVALDVCPFDDQTRAHPILQRFFRHASLWWAFTSAVNFAITLWLLLHHSPTTFVLVKSVLGPVTTTITLGVAALWFRSLMGRTGTAVTFARLS